MATKSSASLARRERERTDTRQKILEAARKMFLRNGYEATTMRAIAEEAEYTATAIYHHFRNKDALLTELCSIDFRALAQAFLRIGRVPDPLERLAKIGEAYVDFAYANPMQYRLMFMTPRPEGFGTHGAHQGDPSEDAYDMLRQTCAEAIASGRLRPELDDPDALAQIAWGAVHGVVSLQIVKGDDASFQWRDARELARTSCATLVRGMLRSADQ
jgi:AcrR family transcriptional regulator